MKIEEKESRGFEFAWKRVSEEEMIGDEWPRNTCDEVDNIFEKKEKVRKRKRRNIGKEQRMNMRKKREREKGSHAAISTPLILPSSSRILSYLSLRGSFVRSQQSRELTFTIRCRDEFVCEELGSRNEIDVGKERRWNR